MYTVMNKLYNMAINRLVSVLITGLNGKESYTGTLAENGEDYIILYMNGKNHKIEAIALRKDIIESIWIYKK